MLTNPRPDHEEALHSIVLSNTQLMQMLEAVRDCRLPDWAVGAGIIRSAVWDHLHGYTEPTHVKDVDVVYFDPYDLGAQRDAGIEASLRESLPNVPWEVTNQASVHLWYADHFGGDPVLPLTSVEEGIGTWPEIATCVGIRLEPDGDLQVIAPYGLDDLFSMIVRHNPARVSLAEFRRRLAQKRMQEKWPLVTILDR